MTTYIQGTCEEFCPESERKLRTKEKLIHFFEYRNHKANVAGILVKSFSRSAAGSRGPKPNDLRTEACLQRTVEYLLKNVIMDKRKPYYVIYDFIFDRLRAVRQEMVIQNFNCQQNIKLLQSIVMFHAYSLYRLCNETIENFDKKICEQHLQECLKWLLNCYDNTSIESMNLLAIKNRIFIEAIYQILNMGTMEALTRSITLPKGIRTNGYFKTAYQMSLHWFQRNLYRTVKCLKDLPHILCAVGSLKLPLIRRHLLITFTYAYNSKVLMVPTEFVLGLSLHSKPQQLYDDCKYLHIQLSTDRDYVHFQIEDLVKSDVPELKANREQFVETKFEQIFLPDILLLKKL